MDNTNGIPFIWDQEEENQLLGQLNPFLETTNFNENSISSSKAFDEITFEKKIGAENKCLPCENSFYQGAMNFKLLISDLREKSRFDNDFFYYQKYTNNLPKVLIANPSMYTMGVTYSEIEDSIPFEYVNPKTKKRIETKFKVGLNTRACLVNFKIFGSRISIDEKNKNINLYIEYIYSDSKDKKIDNTATAVKNDYFIDDKYVAIKLETDDFNDFFALCKEIEIYNTIKIKDLFVEKINATTIPSELDFLYENCPDEVIEIIKRNQEIKEDKIWNDILLLTKLDSEKSFTDTSSAFMNALKLIGYSGSIYDKFFSNQALVKTIYENLDGSSVVNGQQLSNKMQFVNFIYALCAVNEFKGLKRKNKTFKYGPNDLLDSDVFFTFNEKDDEILLQQLKKVQHYYEVNTETDAGVTVNVPTREEVDEEEIEVDQGAYYKVLDIVYLKETSQKNTITFAVPAIFVKALSDEVEFQEIEKNIRLGFDILAIVAGVATMFATANPGLLALALADISLAVGDIAIESVVEELLKTQEGQEFLETWKKIYMVGGLATAIISAPQLVQSFYRLGTTVVKNASKLNNAVLLKGIRDFYLKAYIDINSANFVGNTVKVLEEANEIVLATGGVLNGVKVDQLLRKDVITVIEQIQNGEKLEEQIALIYKGEAIIKAPKKDFYKASKKLMNNLSDEKKFLDICEKIINRRRLVIVEKVDQLGSISKTGSPVKIRIIDELGNFVGELSRSNQKSNLLSYHFIKNGKKIDLKSSVGLYSDSTNNGIVNYLINKGERLIYGDLNFPIDINNKFSGLGNIILNDALHYFTKNPKFESVNGIATLWTENKIYADYGGSSLNLQQFWKNVKEEKMTYEQAALNTFTGKWAKENGFSKVRIKIQEDDILPDEVRLVILKNK